MGRFHFCIGSIFGAAISAAFLLGFLGLSGEQAFRGFIFYSFATVLAAFAMPDRAP